MEMNPIDMIYDPDNAEPIILYNENDEEVSFEQVALIPIGSRDFVILAPLAPMEGVGEGEALAFEITVIDGERVLEVVVDDDVVDQVFEEYYLLLKEEGVDTE